LVGRFALHTIVGVFLFCLVAGAAVLLAYLTEVIERIGVSPYIVMAIRGLELFLLAVDLLCLMFFVGNEAWIFCRDTIRERQPWRIARSGWR
jgi:hypothetical protein